LIIVIGNSMTLIKREERRLEERPDGAFSSCRARWDILRGCV